MSVKKLMGMGALTFVTGIVTALTIGACTSNPDLGPGPTPPGSDAGDSGHVNHPPPPDDADPPDQCPVNQPVTADDLDKQIGWKAATPVQGSCTPTEITKLDANFKDTNVKTYFDLGNGIGDACKACVFSKDTDSKWQMIVGTAADDGQTGFINFGACFGSVDGDDCGKALQYEQFCYNIACNQCTSTATDRQKCVEKAGSEGQMCSAFGDATSKACPSLQTSAKKCNTVIDAVKTLCGGGDGGIDGGT